MLAVVNKLVIITEVRAETDTPVKTRSVTEKTAPNI
jgi:hypothetical protein